MMADGRVYLPPKPWAATVAVFDDGRVGMGSWPGPKDRKAGYDEARAVAEMPSDMVAFRQNLTSLVEDGHFNPWGRWWWGAAPQQKSEQTLTQRSALCITREGFMMYAWGDSASPEALGAALVAARCVRAMHLDMNSGHSGMEFYNVLAPNETRVAGWASARAIASRAACRPARLHGARAQGRHLHGHDAAALHPSRSARLLLSHAQARHRERASGAQGEWSSADLPHAGWPPAFARAGGKRGQLAAHRPRRAPCPRSSAPGAGQLVLAELRGALAAAQARRPGAVRRATAASACATRSASPRRARRSCCAARCSRACSMRRAPSASTRSGLLVYGETSDKSPGALGR